jgi:3-phenylpropionate/trans-cinnamate dioxygenase ferredoxin reductase component
LTFPEKLTICGRNWSRCRALTVGIDRTRDHGSIAGANAAARSAGEMACRVLSTIGAAALKYPAWATATTTPGCWTATTGFTARCEADGAAVGVLPCNTDDDYELGEMLIASGDPAPVPKN